MRGPYTCGHSVTIILTRLCAHQSIFPSTLVNSETRHTQKERTTKFWAFLLTVKRDTHKERKFGLSSLQCETRHTENFQKLYLSYETKRTVQEPQFFYGPKTSTESSLPGATQLSQVRSFSPRWNGSPATRLNSFSSLFSSLTPTLEV